MSSPEKLASRAWRRAIESSGARQADAHDGLAGRPCRGTRRSTRAGTCPPGVLSSVWLRLARGAGPGATRADRLPAAEHASQRTRASVGFHAGANEPCGRWAGIPGTSDARAGLAGARRLEAPEELLDRRPEVRRASPAPRCGPAAPGRWAGRACTSRSSCAACGAPPSGRRRSARSPRSGASMRSRRSASVASRGGPPGEQVGDLAEDPRVLHRGAPDHDGVAAGLAKHRERVLGRVSTSPLPTTGIESVALQLGDPRPVGLARVHLPRRAGVHRDGGDALVLAHPAELEEVHARGRRAPAGTSRSAGSRAAS